MDIPSHRNNAAPPDDTSVDVELARRGHDFNFMEVVGNSVFPRQARDMAYYSTDSIVNYVIDRDQVFLSICIYYHVSFLPNERIDVLYSRHSALGLD